MKSGPETSLPGQRFATFGRSAMDMRNPSAAKYYLPHHFLKEQPALNLAEIRVQGGLLDRGRYWLDMGVDGFRFRRHQQFL